MTESKAQETESEFHTETIPENFIPTQEQINLLAQRIMPEIKILFADIQIQEEFEKWQNEKRITL
ncbi:MAG: hypothetical protein LBD23_09800 [Oscillospiraceae bacterium]|nr:hypothetical protein [Oscillospiraceae bacterium]